MLLSFIFVHLLFVTLPPGTRFEAWQQQSAVFFFLSLASYRWWEGRCVCELGRGGRLAFKTATIHLCSCNCDFDLVPLWSARIVVSISLPPISACLFFVLLFSPSISSPCHTKACFAKLQHKVPEHKQNKNAHPAWLALMRFKSKFDGFKQGKEKYEEGGRGRQEVFHLGTAASPSLLWARDQTGQIQVRATVYTHETPTLITPPNIRRRHGFISV